MKRRFLFYVVLIAFFGACDEVVPESLPEFRPQPGLSPTTKDENDSDMIAVRPAYSRILGLGNRQALVLRFWPVGGGVEDITAESWTSDDPKVATVDASGLVTAVSEGSTLIRAVYDGEEALARVVVESVTLSETVLQAPTPAAEKTEERPEESEVEESPSPSPEAHFADSVVSYVLGDGGGFNEEKLPAIVLGPAGGGAFDVLSLGVGGEIVLEFTNYAAVDGAGSDLAVFENAFKVNGSDVTFAEPGIVGVSEDGESFVDFPCDLNSYPYAGCAGVTPTEDGGDAFDLAEVGLKKARFVRIRDSGLGLGPIGPGTRGFDLDAVAILHGTLPE